MGQVDVEVFLKDNKKVIMKYTDRKGFNIIYKFLVNTDVRDKWDIREFRDTINRALDCAEYSLWEHKHVLYKIKRIGKDEKEK